MATKLGAVIGWVANVLQVPATCSLVALVLHERFQFPSVTTTCALVCCYQLYVRTVYKDDP